MSFLKNIFAKDTREAAVATTKDSVFSTEYLLSAPEIVGWLSIQEQELLFSQILWPAVIDKTDSILDVGCGRADMFGFLSKWSENVSYKGIDTNANVIEIAKTKYPGVNVSVADIMTYESDTYDWVLGSGLFNLKDHPDMFSYALECIDKMYILANKGVAFNLLTGIPSDLAQSDIDQLYVHNSGQWLDILIKKYTTVIAKADYMNGDITFFILK